MSFIGKKAACFIGGAVTSLVVEHCYKTKEGRSLVVNAVAKGLKVKDNVVATYETLKEEAADIKEEAIAKNNQE